MPEETRTGAATAPRTPSAVAPEHDQDGNERPARRPRTFLMIVGALLVVAIGVATVGLSSSQGDDSPVAGASDQQAVPTGQTALFPTDATTGVDQTIPPAGDALPSASTVGAPEVLAPASPVAPPAAPLPVPGAPPAAPGAPSAASAGGAAAPAPAGVPSSSGSSSGSGSSTGSGSSSTSNGSGSSTGSGSSSGNTASGSSSNSSRQGDQRGGADSGGARATPCSITRKGPPKVQQGSRGVSKVLVEGFSNTCRGMTVALLVPNGNGNNGNGNGLLDRRSGKRAERARVGDDGSAIFDFGSSPVSFEALRKATLQLG